MSETKDVRITDDTKETIRCIVIDAMNSAITEEWEVADFHMKRILSALAPTPPQPEAPVQRSGFAIRITFEEAQDRRAKGLHVDWAECVGLHYFPAYDTPQPEAPDVGLVAENERETVKRRFVLEWIGEARPPVHPNPMTGRLSFSSINRALEFMRNQAPDSQFVSLTEVETSHTDRSASFRAALAAGERK